MNCKTIALPGLPDINITPILPIVDTPVFQKLRSRRQLGVAYLTFPTAQHTRWEHSVGTYYLTTQRTTNWQQDGAISEEDAFNINLAGLLHDIGHGPYSHVTEPLCSRNHGEYGLGLLTRHLGHAITECGGNPAHISRLLRREDPLHCCITHRPLGTDKLDYLMRDARSTSEAVSLRLGDLLYHSCYRDGQLAIDLKIMSEAARAQQDYIYMHERVYLRKSCLIAQRFLQKIVAGAMAAKDGIPAEVLACLTDSELDALLLSFPDAKKTFRRLQERALPKMAVRIVPTGVVSHDRLDGKAIATYEVPQDQLERFNHYQDPQEATKIEARIAEIANIPAEAVLIVPVVTPERFVPEDIHVYEGSRRIGSFRELRPAHYASLQETARSYAAVRVCVFAEYREQVAAPACANRIIELFLNETVP